jgi:hypothetical protein
MAMIWEVGKIECGYIFLRDEDYIYIQLLIHKQTGSILKPSIIEVEGISPRIFKYVPEDAVITTFYDKNSLREFCPNVDDVDNQLGFVPILRPECRYIMTGFKIILSDENKIKLVRTKKDAPIPRDIPKQQRQVIHDTVYKLAKIFLDFDPKHDTKETIHKKVSDVFNNVKNIK